MAKLAACTIVSNNYLAFARVLARSFKEHHPTGQFYTLIVDRPDPAIDYAAEPFEATFVEDLGIPYFLNMAFRYSILELNTAVKPFWLSYLHRSQRLPEVCYFDPDILILDSLADLYAKLADHDLLLTPHITAPIRDSHHPSERDILRAGIYNLGFLGVGFNRRSLDFLDWWGQRLHESGVSDVEKGLFVDQKWMDLAPAFLSRALIADDPGLNVAYWNLMHRRVTSSEGKWRVGDVRLRFFHFSGFDPHNPQAVSKHQNRFTLSDLPELGPLFKDYSQRLLSQGAEDLRTSQYAYGFLDNGVRVPGFCRQTLQMLDMGARWPDPFRTGSGSYYEWLRAPSPQHPELPRLALSLWDHDPLCRQMFTFERSSDVERFGRWLVSDGARLHGIDEAFFQDWMQSGRRSLAGPHSPRAGQGAALESDLDSLLRSGNPGRALKLWLSKLGAASDFWLQTDAAQDDLKPKLTRLAFAIYRSRQDLRELYPQPLGTSRSQLARWFVTSGAVEYDLPLDVIAPVLSSFPLPGQIVLRLWWLVRRRTLRLGSRSEDEVLPSQPGPGLDSPSTGSGGYSPTPAKGVHVIGYLGAPTGKGQEGRGTLAGLEAAGVSHRGWSVSGRSQRFAEEDSSMLALEEEAAFPIVLYHINADMMGAVRRQLPALLRSCPIHIGYWDWELNHFPLNFSDRFDGLTEVWAPSRFCRRTFASLASIPVRWVPPCVIPAEAEPLPRRLLGVPEEAFLFFNSFDIRSIPERKNPEGLVEAFRLLNQLTDQEAHLLLKINHSEDQHQQLEGLRAKAQDLPVTFMTEQKSREEMNALMATCDCYVSLHRSEGLGLPLIEAMYLEKPVVATGYSGNADFLDESTGWPVAYSMCRLEKDIGPYPAGTVWADPDPADAAQQMLSVLSRADERGQRAQEARKKVMDTYSPQAAGQRFSRQLDRLLDGLDC